MSYTYKFYWEYNAEKEDGVSIFKYIGQA
jgi:hypothetical protein